MNVAWLAPVMCLRIQPPYELEGDTPYLVGEAHGLPLPYRRGDHPPERLLRAEMLLIAFMAAL